MTIFTSDVYSGDGPVDWAAARSAGISAACAKATEAGIPGGYAYTSPLFYQQYERAVQAGVELVGAYHCLARGSVDAQIQYFRSVVEGRGERTWHWAMLDVEPFDELQNRQIVPRFADVEEFCQLWWSQLGSPLALYLPHWVWTGFGSPSLTGLAGKVRLVSSNYPSSRIRPFRELYDQVGGDTGPGWAPYGGLTPTLWQYSSSALIPGVRGGVDRVDVNAFRGDLATLRQLLTGGNGSQPVPPQQPQGDDMLTHWTTLGPSSLGDAVRAAQGLLLAAGASPGNLDGIYGPRTAAATRGLQSRHGIAVDGLFGPHTLSCALYGRDLG